jgi:hypothetical protein
MLVGVAALIVALVLYGLVFASIAFVGFDAVTAAAAIGLTSALAWSGIARWYGASSAAHRWSALRVLLAPIVGRGSRVRVALGLASLPMIAYALVSITAGLDWNFVIQKLGVLLIWLVAFASVHTICENRNTVRGRVTLVVPLLVLGLFRAADAYSANVLLDRYAAVDLSFRFIRDLRVAQSRDTADFYNHLKANTLVLPARVSVGDIDFARPSGAPMRPHIFLFLIDSLRRDYVSPYNHSITFTRSIAEFASDSFVFDRAFTRYAGTGLAVPSIWAGGMLIHMLEQQPFDGRDALLKLLEGEGYRRVMGIDHIVRELIPPSPDVVELDRDLSPMDCEFCRTMHELEGRLAASLTDPRPVFSYTLSQNVHIAVASKRIVPADRSYPGFFAPVAESVRQVDACFGEFIAFLRRMKLYDDSIIIITSDHGDSLGEEGRWGHAYFMVPEVMRIPLIVHLPPALRTRFATDLGRVSFSTDITPTLYALLGHPPANLGPLFGESLFVPPGTDLSARRRESFLLASSYGAVYGVLRHNGRKLYTADALAGRDDAYDLTGDGLGRRTAMTNAFSALNRRLISEQLDQLAALNHFTPQP